MSIGIQQPSARFCFFTAGLLYFESKSYSFCDTYCYRHTGSRPEQAIGSLLERCLEQTRDSDPQLALIHAKPSHSPISIAWNRWKEASGSGCCHNSLCMSRHTASFSIVPQLILTLCIPSLMFRSPAYHYGHLNWVIGIVIAIAVAMRAFQSTHLPICHSLTYFTCCKKSNQM